MRKIKWRAAASSYGCPIRAPSQCNQLLVELVTRNWNVVSSRKVFSRSIPYRGMSPGRLEQ